MPVTRDKHIVHNLRSRHPSLLPRNKYELPNAMHSTRQIVRKVTCVFICIVKYQYQTRQSNILVTRMWFILHATNTSVKVQYSLSSETCVQKYVILPKESKALSSLLAQCYLDHHATQITTA